MRDSGQKSAPKFHKYHKRMGSGRDKRKKAKPKAPGAGADKTVRKTEKNADKAVKRATKAAQVSSFCIEGSAGMRLHKLSSIHYDTRFDMQQKSEPQSANTGHARFELCA